MDKREFLRTLGGSSLGLFLGPDLLDRMAGVPPAILAADEPFWAQVRASYRLTPDYINLESGYFSMQAQPVLEAFVGRVRQLNLEHSRYMRTVMRDDKARVAARLAAMAGCGADELIITRNTTEGLDTVIAGHDWKAGDEAVMASHDYGAMLDQFTLMARRHGIVNRVVQVPLHPRSDDEVVQAYAAAITPRTRLLLISHIVNLTGQVLPVRAVADMAHARGVAVLVDGAHAFAQLEYRIPNLGADYYAASLHKWLGAPHGTGFLYLREDLIEEVWPLFPAPAARAADIRKFESVGTAPSAPFLAIPTALDFWAEIGPGEKLARLRWLRDRWVDVARTLPGARSLTRMADEGAGALATFHFAGRNARALAADLLDRERILVRAIVHPEFNGIRVAPNLFNSAAEIDRFALALRRVLRG